jgi:hypothetical protein
MTTQTNTRQDSAFYTYSQDSEIVWSNDPNQRFYVVRNGEMRIHAMKNGHEVVIRYTDDLEDLGITNDEELGKWSAKEEMFEWVNNSWFEVYDSLDPEYYSEPIHSLDEAINFAKELSTKYGKELPVGDGEPNGAWL